MKKNSLIVMAGVIVLIVASVAIIADYYSLENQILRDIDKYNENGKDVETGNEIMGKIGLMAANSEERLQSFLAKNPKVNDFLVEWAKTHS